MVKNYQDLFLCQARKEKMQVTIFLVSGYQIKGCIENFDNYIIILESDGRQQMIFKHAISTIIPHKYIQNLDTLKEV